jgi:hypothetical protein
MSLSSNDLKQLLERVGLQDEAAQEELQFERALTDNALRTLEPVRVPKDLSLRIRLALSHERVRAERRFTGRLKDRWISFRENSLQPFALQGAVITAALVATIGGALMLGAVAPQQTVEANDEPLTGFSAPRFMYSAATEQPVASVGDEPVMVQAMVDTKGRVYDYRVLSGQLDETATAALRQRMLTGVFQPAKVFGQPVRGRVLLTFADVVVRG